MNKNQKIVLTIFTLGLIIISISFFIGCGRSVQKSPTTSTTTSSFPGPFNFVLGTNTYSLPSLTLPAKGGSVTDPNFNLTITRVTDKNIDGYSGPGIENEYAKMDPENCDGTLLILRGNDGEWYLYNTATFQMIKHLNILSGLHDPEPRWDPSNPKIFYTPYGTELRSYNVDTDAFSTIHDFKNDFPTADYIFSNTEGDASVDRRYWFFIVRHIDTVSGSHQDVAVVCYDKTQNLIVGQKNAPFKDEINWVGMDMSGNHCIIGYGTQETQVFPRNLSSVKDLPTGAVGHMDLAQTVDGKDVMVYQNNVTDWIAMADLDNPATEINLVEIPFGVNPDIGLHVSGNCAQIPGWALISTYGSKNPPSGKSHSWMDTQLFMVELKANPRIWRLAFTQCFTWLDAPPPGAESTYYYEAFATINTKGTKIYYGSNWGIGVTNNYSTPLSNYTDGFEISLPASWNTRMPAQ